MARSLPSEASKASERRADLAVALLGCRIGPTPAGSSVDHKRVAAVILDALDVDLDGEHSIDDALIDDARRAVGGECDILGQDRERDARIRAQPRE